MCHILRTLAGIGEIDEVYAYCSDERICEYLPRGVRFLRRSPGLDRDTTLGREIYDSFTADVEADLYAGARHLAVHPRGDRGGRPAARAVGGTIRRSAPKIQTFAWFEGRPLNLCAGRHPPHADHRAGLYRNQRIFHFPRARSGVRPRTPHQGKNPHGCRRPHRKGLDIDNPEDFTMAEIIAASRRLG